MPPGSSCLATGVLISADARSPTRPPDRHRGTLGGRADRRAAASRHARDGRADDGRRAARTRVADALGTPVWVYSRGHHARARYRALRRGAATPGSGAHIHYAVKANDHLAVLRAVRGRGRRRRRGERGRVAAARWPPASRPAASCSPASARARASCASRWSEDIGADQRRERGGARHALRRSPPRWAARRGSRCGSTRTSTPARTPRSAPAGRATSSASPMATPRRCTPAPPPCRASSRSASRCISAARSSRVAPYRAAFARLAELVRGLRAAGHAGRDGRLRRRPRHRLPRRAGRASPAALAGAIRATLGGLDVRADAGAGPLAGRAGRRAARLRGAGQARRGHRRFVVLDAAMNDLVRPAMYDAWHGIVPVSAVDARRARDARPTSSGRSARPGDTFARDRLLPPLAPNARVAILDAGAYGAVMSSTYNARPLAAEAMVRRRTLGRHPRPPAGRGAMGRASGCRTGSGKRGRMSEPRLTPEAADRGRPPAAPAARPARARPAARSCSSGSGPRSGRRSASPGCSSAWRCSTSRACCRPGRTRCCSLATALAHRGSAGTRPARVSPRRTTRRPTGGWSSRRACGTARCRC